MTAAKLNSKNASGQPGKIMIADTNDLNGDGVPDLVEGYTGLTLTGNSNNPIPDTTQVVAGLQFTPVDIVLPVGTDLANTTLVLNYDFSDPQGVTVAGSGTQSDPYIYSAAAGDMRIWTKDASTQRDGSADVLPSDVPFAATKLSFTQLGDGSSETKLYMEGVAGVSEQQIELTTQDNTSGAAGGDGAQISVIDAQMSPQFTDGTPGALAVSLKNTTTGGGWVLLNSNDYNYNLDGSGNLIPADVVTAPDGTDNTHVAGDAALAPLQIVAPQPAPSGIWSFAVTGGLRLWLNSDRSGAVTTFAANALPAKIYVEGIGDSFTQGDQTITLYWQANANAPKVQVDQVKETVLEIQGAQNVPGNATSYFYSIALPSIRGPQSPVWSLPAAQGTITASDVDVGSPPGPPVTLVAVVDWSAGPVVGVLTCLPSKGFALNWNVNVVEVSAGTGSVTAPPGAVKTDNTAISGRTQVSDPGWIVFSDSFTLAGPNANWGAQFMNVGFVQNWDQTSDNASYLDQKTGTTFAAEGSDQGASAVDCIDVASEPWAGPVPLVPGEYDDFWSAPTLAVGQTVGVQTLSYEDSPTMDPYSTFTSKTGDLGTLNSAMLTQSFTSYLAVQTRDDENGSAEVYTQLAFATWATNYSLVPNPSGGLSGVAAQAITAPTATYTIINTGAVVPITTGPIANNIQPVWSDL